MKNHIINEQNLSQTIVFSDPKTHIQTNIKQDESYLLHYTFTEKFDVEVWDYYLNILPRKFQNEVLRYRRWQDRYNCLIGKLLVYVGHYMFCGASLEFDRFLKDSFGKPYIENCNIHFNISHSENTVVCAFSKKNIGVDIEEINNLDVTMFDNVFSSDEMEKINKDGVSRFYEFWTIKEAVSKAIGQGLGIPLLEIKIKNQYAIYDNNKWQIKSYKMQNKYCTVASGFCSNLILKEIKF
ncbi:4'-phosphopantetheinyl transferase family protein [Aquimarina litoralis]|uniref:4'-phosphopantetheinyl transferase family protein n=1 Tax=Aquimarina litoralis TaxID=584605 RepID=UPI001C57618B|nr:4'-phosphopantetheinyl transferase superfamily protein [Aquimarina litoralis]MBW1295677.1 4'-phosphopantetheinyl transferase superfamily protein [Aquimarina litoralis]